jgi:type II secretory pathway pseudopilin PulG
MKTNKGIATAIMGIMIVLGVSSSLWADQQTRLRASVNKRINGFEAELRGDFREDHGAPDRLNAELEKINLPIGTKVAFCLVQNGTTSLLGVAKVQLEAGVSVAEFELETKDGDNVPTINAGDVLQARQRTASPFQQNPTCTTNLLVSGPFEK